MNLLYQSAFFEALGWSLIDSMWQMGAIWVCYSITTANSSRFTSDKRHSLALLGTAAGTLLFFISFLFNYYFAVNNKHLFSLSYFLEREAGDAISNYFPADALVPFLSLIYLPLVAYFSLRLILQFNSNKNIYRKYLLPADDKLEKLIVELSERFGIVRKATLLISEKVESPLTIGFWKPLILLPIAALNQLSCRQVEAIISHELFHIKRNDYLLNILLAISEVVLFFNPFARLMCGIVKKERENSCDDHVIAAGFDAWEYSQALYLLGKYRHNTTLAIAATGVGKEYLLQRIRRMMHRNNPSPSVTKPFIAFFLCLLVAGFASRQSKQVPVLVKANIPADVKPLVFYLEEKKIVISETASKKVPGSVKSPIKKTVKKKATPSKKINPSEPSLTESAGEYVSTYVYVPESLEFSMIDPEVPEVPEQVTCEKQMPYVPNSSFYYTEIDSTEGRKTIKL